MLEESRQALEFGLPFLTLGLLVQGPLVGAPAAPTSGRSKA
ncbi:hypothetical protein [Streptomyces sp. MMBL 11-1]|nr:hypothetical protein [Streptomyces sp. MMBL 11-1]